MKSIFKNFFKFSVGFRRLFIVGTILPLIIGANIRYSNLILVIICCIAYWVSVLLLAWIYAGFKENSLKTTKMRFEDLMNYLNNELEIDTQSIKEESGIWEQYLQRAMTDEEKVQFVNDILKRAIRIKKNQN